MTNSWIVDSDERLLTFLKNKSFKTQEDFSTKDLRWSIEHNRCSVNNVIERFASFRLKKGDLVAIVPEKRPFFQHELERVLYEDPWLLIYNKPPYIDSPSLAKLLNLHLVHRLDRDTTGVILFAKDQTTLHLLENLFRKREMKKEYLALVEGEVLKKNGTIESLIDGKAAKTSWECEKRLKNASLLRCYPLTGRTHQIRIHLKRIGHPIVGDCEYGNRRAIENVFRPLLHAAKLSFIHPYDKKELQISAEISYHPMHVKYRS